MSKWIVYDQRGEVDTYVDADSKSDAIKAAQDDDCPDEFTIIQAVPLKLRAKVTVVSLGNGFVVCDCPSIKDVDFDVAEGVDIDVGEYRIYVNGWGVNNVMHGGVIERAEKWTEQDCWEEARELLTSEWPKISFVVEENEHAGGVQITGDIKMPIGRDPFRIRIDIDKNGKYRARLYMKVLINGVIEKRDVYESTSKSPVIAAEGLSATLRAVYAFVDAAQ